MGTYCFGHGCGLWMLWLYFGVARVMIICLVRICISSDIRVLIYTIVSVEKYYIVLLPTYNDPLSSSHQTIFLSSLSHHAAPVFLTACLPAWKTRASDDFDTILARLISHDKKSTKMLKERYWWAFLN